STLVGLLYMRTGIFEEYAEPWQWAVGIGLVSLPLALRRRFPEMVAVLVALGFYICGSTWVPDLLITNICMFLAIYSVGAWSKNRAVAWWVRLTISALMLGWVLVEVFLSSADTELFEGISRTGIFSAFATYAVIQIITNLL